jgi:hypothetical protein
MEYPVEGKKSQHFSCFFSDKNVVEGEENGYTDPSLDAKGAENLFIRGTSNKLC